MANTRVARHPGTRRIDEGEKKDAYLTIPSLAVYALVEQPTPAVVVFRRTDQEFVPEVHEGSTPSFGYVWEHSR